ncbi:MAG: hypothetical protein IT349_19250 [Candidatus Eisenbacteria bacterium]|nr:hypothetical protein [Candidatus Eisenbacteria bacterium]
MGPEVIIPAIISAAGTYMQYEAQRGAEKKRQKQIDDMMAYNAAQSNKIVGDIEAEAPRYTQQNMQAETQSVQQASEDRLMQDLESALSPTSRQVPLGKVSDEYIAKKAEKQAAETERGANLARLFAAIDAPGQTRLKQSLDSADARARRQAIASGSQYTLQNMGNQYAGIQPDAALTTGGGLLIGGAGAYSNASANERIKEALNPKLPQKPATMFYP